MILLIAVCVMMSITSMAEPPQKMYNKGGFNKAKIDSIKIAFITKHLGLTEQQSPAFWPIYNKYESEKKSLVQSVLGNDNPKRSLNDLSDTDADKVIDNYFLLKTKELDLSKKYISEFKKVLDSKQVAKLITSEKQFKDMLMKYGQNKLNMYKKTVPPKDSNPKE